MAALAGRRDEKRPLINQSIDRLIQSFITSNVQITRKILQNITTKPNAKSPQVQRISNLTFFNV